MSNNFIVAVEAVIPLFGLIAVGLIVKKMKLLTDLELVHINKMVFTIFFFDMMFYNIYTAKIGTMLHPQLVIFSLLMLAAIYIGSVAFVCLTEKDNRKRGAMIQAMYRSNFVFMGIPMAANICGDENIAVTTVLVTIIVPIYNVLAVFTLEMFRGGKFHFWTILWGVLKNPMIFGALCALVFRLLGIDIPKAVMRPIAQVNSATTPIALIVLGASFSFVTVKKSMHQLVTCVFARLIVVPAIAAFAAMQFGFRGIDFVTVLAIFAQPCAVAGYAMAQQMDSDADLARNCVVFSSALSCFTIFMWVYLFKTLEMF